MINSGPGWMPCTSIAEIISAAIGVKGMPSASSGTSEAVAAELLAASGTGDAFDRAAADFIGIF